MTPKILIVRFSSIGDIVLTSPIIRAVKRQVNGGDVEVHFLSKRIFAPVLSANPYIDRTHWVDQRVSEVLGTLKNLHFDFVADLHHSMRTGQVRRALRRPTGTFNKHSLHRLLYVHLGIACMPPNHTVDRYFEVVRPLGVVHDGEGLEYYLGPDDRVDPADLPETHREGYVAVVIGGQHLGKLYPVERLIGLCRMLNEPVILLGGGDDRERGEAVAAQGGGLVLNGCGGFSLNQSAALVRDARCVVSNDTGLMHVAAAFKKKVISLWGATVPEFGLYPYQPGLGSVVLQSQCPGRPYSRHGGKLPLRPPFTCWDGLEPEMIVAAIRSQP